MALWVCLGALEGSIGSCSDQKRPRDGVSTKDLSDRLGEPRLKKGPRVQGKVVYYCIALAQNICFTYVLLSGGLT